jgi:DNA-binding NarL/FixJ family response regulator
MNDLSRAEVIDPRAEICRVLHDPRPASRPVTAARAPATVQIEGAPMSRIRVLIADDHQVVREGLQSVIEREPDMRVVALAADGEQALLAAREHAPHVAVVDMRMPKLGGVAAIKKLREGCPETKVLVLSMYDDPRYARAALDAGASGYVSKHSAATTLLEAIRTLHAGQRFAGGHQPAHAAAELGELSTREQEVLRLLVAGHTSRATAEALGISKSTVDTYRARIFQKLGVDNRAELMARLRWGTAEEMEELE